MDLSLNSTWSKNLLLVILLLCLSCNENKSIRKNVSQLVQKSDVEKSDSTFEQISTIRNSPQIFSKRLTPLEIVDSTSNNVYKKFGIEFGGSCYSCDLADIQLTEKNIILINICDSQIVFEFPIESISETKDVIEIRTNKRNFIFTKIAKTPIYQLSIKGSSFTMHNLRLLDFYTFVSRLHKFEQKDCGDFQG